MLSLLRCSACWLYACTKLDLICLSAIFIFYSDEAILRLCACLFYNHVRMKALLLKVWKWLPFGLQRLFSHILLPSFQVFAVAVIFNSDKQILLGKATYQRIHPWGLPGGSLKLGEEPEQAVVREMLEETGLNIEVKNLLMAKNSSARDQIGLFYWCNILGGEFHPSSLSERPASNDKLLK
jgi:hypothetical protein